MNKIIIYTNSSGGVSVVSPSKDLFKPDSLLRQSLPFLNGKTDEELLNWVVLKDVPINTAYKIIENSDLPSREYRDAWKNNGQSIDHDMVKARDIHKNKMRQARENKLKSLDIEYQKADELGETQKKKIVADKKQALRDVTSHPGINSANNIEELKLVWPEILNGEGT